MVEFDHFKKDIMELTGKCKEDFEKWVNQNHQKLIVRMGSEKTTTGTLILWDEFPLSLKWGVYVDFFESLEPVPIPLDKTMMDLYYAYPGDYDKETSREAAIKKANEIYNKNALK